MMRLPASGYCKEIGKERWEDVAFVRCCRSCSRARQAEKRVTKHRTHRIMRLNRFSYNSLMFAWHRCHTPSNHIRHLYLLAVDVKINCRKFVVLWCDVHIYGIWGHFTTLIAVGIFCGFARKRQKSTDWITLFAPHSHKVDGHRVFAVAGNNERNCWIENAMEKNFASN